MKQSDAANLLTEIRNHPTVSVEVAGQILGLSRNCAYEAANRGDIPAIRIGRLLRVPTARLLAMLGQS